MASQKQKERNGLSLEPNIFCRRWRLANGSLERRKWIQSFSFANPHSLKGGDTISLVRSSHDRFFKCKLVSNLAGSKRRITKHSYGNIWNRLRKWSDDDRQHRQTTVSHHQSTGNWWYTCDCLTQDYVSVIVYACLPRWPPRGQQITPQA